MKPRNIIIFILWLPLLISAQTYHYANDVEGNWLESLAESDIESVDVSKIEYLTSLRENPANINTMTKENLENFFFLSDLQIENLLFYLYENGPLKSIYELQGIRGFDQHTILLLIQFICIENPPVKTRNKANGYSLFRGSTLIQTPDGYRSIEDSDPKYQGDKLKLLLRSEIEYSKLKIGFSAEKDPGEQLIRESSPTPDLLAGYLQFSSKGIINQIILGTYRIGFGQGIAISNYYSYSMLSDPVNIRLRSQHINGYNSTDEYNYLRGATMTLVINKHIKFSPFISIKNLDGISNEDPGFVNNINKTGYHRTLSEIESRNNIRETLGGSALELNFKRFSIDAGVYYYDLDHGIKKDNTPYQYYEYNGSPFVNKWISYTSFFRKCVLFGELSQHKNNSYGLVQGAIWEPDSRFGISLKINSYDCSYFAPYSSFENSSGENNISIGLKLLPVNKLNIKAYQMYTNYTWLKYQVDQPSSKMESMINLDYNITRAFRTSFRYRHQLKQLNYAEPNSPSFETETIHQHQFRFNFDYTVTKQIELATRIENCRYLPDISSLSIGWLIYQDLQYISPKKNLRILLRYCHFDTDDYRSRIYSYEPNVLYAFSVPAYSGEGIKYILNTSYKWKNHFILYLRLSTLQYFKVDHIGSGNELIKGNKKSEIVFQIKYNI